MTTTVNVVFLESHAVHRELVTRYRALETEYLMDLRHGWEQVMASEAATRSFCRCRLNAIDHVLKERAGS